MQGKRRVSSHGGMRLNGNEVRGKRKSGAGAEL